MQLNLNRTQDMKMIHLFLTCPSRPLSTLNSAKGVTHLEMLGSLQSSQAGSRRCSGGGHTALRGLEEHCQLVNSLRITKHIKHEFVIKTGHTRKIAEPKLQKRWCAICQLVACYPFLIFSLHSEKEKKIMQRNTKYLCSHAAFAKQSLVLQKQNKSKILNSTWKTLKHQV